ncbi:hypothetical protein D0Z07_5081 [Hyphodiscus hymeniophilus]|uniref:Uncharacterized protein n=1 Tax=Hyphodiscus hymeniophilus TaxID=353542 RepID=A0A9P7AWH3_9HELO|nr:hypothetical protein D0Z07_5081 [Hyphodiscus hymeniophilus]
MVINSLKKFDPNTNIPDLSAKGTMVSAKLLVSRIRAGETQSGASLSALSQYRKAVTAIEETKAASPAAKVSLMEYGVASLFSVKKAAEDHYAGHPHMQCWYQQGASRSDHRWLRHDVRHKPAEPFSIDQSTLAHSAPDFHRTRFRCVRIVILSSTGHIRPPKGGMVFKYLKPLRSRTSFFFGDPHRVRQRLSGSGWLTVYDGVKNQLWAATGSKNEVMSGEYYVPVGVTAKDSKLSENKGLERELWIWTEAIRGVFETCLN